MGSEQSVDEHIRSSRHCYGRYARHHRISVHNRERVWCLKKSNVMQFGDPFEDQKSLILCTNDQPTVSIYMNSRLWSKFCMETFYVKEKDLLEGQQASHNSMWSLYSPKGHSKHSTTAHLPPALYSSQMKG